jgi:ribosomal protein L32
MADKKIRIITDKRWLGKDEIYDNFFQCPECGENQLQHTFKWCPKCGVKLGWKISEKYKDDD